MLAARPRLVVLVVQLQRPAVLVVRRLLVARPRLVVRPRLVALVVRRLLVVPPRLVAVPVVRRLLVVRPRLVAVQRLLPEPFLLREAVLQLLPKVPLLLPGPPRQTAVRSRIRMRAALQLLSLFSRII